MPITLEHIAQTVGRMNLGHLATQESAGRGGFCRQDFNHRSSQLLLLFGLHQFRELEGLAPGIDASRCVDGRLLTSGS